MQDIDLDKLDGSKPLRDLPKLEFVLMCVPEAPATDILRMMANPVTGEASAAPIPNSVFQRGEIKRTILPIDACRALLLLNLKHRFSSVWIFVGD